MLREIMSLNLSRKIIKNVLLGNEIDLEYFFDLIKKEEEKYKVKDFEIKNYSKEILKDLFSLFYISAFKDFIKKYNCLKDNESKIIVESCVVDIINNCIIYPYLCESVSVASILSKEFYLNFEFSSLDEFEKILLEFCEEIMKFWKKQLDKENENLFKKKLREVALLCVSENKILCEEILKKEDDFNKNIIFKNIKDFNKISYEDRFNRELFLLNFFKIDENKMSNYDNGVYLKDKFESLKKYFELEQIEFLMSRIKDKDDDIFFNFWQNACSLIKEFDDKKFFERIKEFDAEDKAILIVSRFNYFDSMKANCCLDNYALLHKYIILLINDEDIINYCNIEDNRRKNDKDYCKKEDKYSSKQFVSELFGISEILIDYIINTEDILVRG